MAELHEVLSERVAGWRAGAYLHDAHPTIAEILLYARQEDGSPLDPPIPARVIVDDFISPSILERLTSQEGVLAPQVTDWRSMVDSVMIDTAYDGNVFNVVAADIPERKTDLVTGAYHIQLDWERPYTPVAVKLTDMLGEEVLVVLDGGRRHVVYYNDADRSRGRSPAAAQS